MTFTRGLILIFLFGIFLFIFIALIDDAIRNNSKKFINKQRKLNRLKIEKAEEVEFKKQWRAEYEKKRKNTNN